MSTYSIIISVLLLSISMIAKGLMDKSGANKFKGRSVFKNRSESWSNKYTYPLVHGYKHWYYFGIFNPKYKEAFPYSTTLFVALTDYWHKMQFVYLNTLYVSYSIFASASTGYSILLCFIVVRFIYFVLFNLTYER